MLIQKTKKLTIADPLLPTTQIGAVISSNHAQKIMDYIQLAHKEGGQLLTGEEKIIVPSRCANGNFIAPTVLKGISPGCHVNQEKIFGPVISIIPFENGGNALQIANYSQYGLAA